MADTHAPLVDLAMPRGDSMGEAIAMPSAPTGPQYPYGCCISLDDETLKKLGLAGDMPAAGEMIHFCAEAKVTCCTQNDRVNPDGSTESCNRVELQIVRMGVPGSPDNRSERWYGQSNDEPDGDED